MQFNAEWDSPILELPVWTPGSYKIRDYAKHIHNFGVKNQSGPIGWKKISKNQWKLEAQENDTVEVSYKVYAFDMTVRTSYLSDRYGLLSPASIFYYVVTEDGEKNTKDNEYTVKITVPQYWKVFTSLHQTEDTYIAEDYDELVDSPFGLAHQSDLESTTYTIDNSDGTEIPCEIALIGQKGNQDIDKFKEELIKLQEKSIEMFGSLPYDRYLWVLYVVGSGGGGLEHKYSNFSIINRWYFESDKLKYAKLMSLEAHEHFHAYNIKRIRPSQLGPFDYTKEVYTSLLWVAEGVTSFYDNIFLPRAGIIEPETYWKVIAKDYSSLQKVPGRFETSIAESSYDAWIKLYQRHEGADNLFVSYYLKGGLVSFMLDLEIRKQTAWEKSLDDFFREMYDQYQQNGKTYNEDDLRELIENWTGTDLEEFWGKYIEGTDELPFEKYLNLIGLELSHKTNDVPYIGLEFPSEKKRKKVLKVKKVRQDSPAMKAGIYSKDKIIAFDSYEVTPSNYKRLLKNLGAGTPVMVHFIRDGILRIVEMIPEEPEIEEYCIVEKEDATDLEIQHRKEFLHLN